MQRRAGQFAEERFRERRRAWLRRVWWVLPVVAVLVVGLVAGVGVLVRPSDPSFFWGLGVGAALALVMCFADSPPPHIERWRQGAQGERDTARVLRPLTTAGWTLFNDIDRGRGNIDHVLVGPAGVFLLETKNLNGLCSVQRGALSVRWREDPDDGYENRSIAPRARAVAAELAEALRTAGLRRHWVQPVVVLWAEFSQRSVESESVAWVRGKDLADVLGHRPIRLTTEEIAEVVRALEAHVSRDAR